MEFHHVMGTWALTCRFRDPLASPQGVTQVGSKCSRDAVERDMWQ